MRLLKFLLGLAIGAAAGVLLAPKSGRELREQLLGGAAGKLLPPVADHYPLPDSTHATTTGTSVLEQPSVTEAPEEAPVEEDAAVGEDLLERIEQTRAAVAADLAEPFGSASETETAMPEGVDEAPAEAEVAPEEEAFQMDAPVYEWEQVIQEVPREENDETGSATAPLVEIAGESMGESLIADIAAIEPLAPPVWPWEEEATTKGEELVAEATGAVLREEPAFAEEPVIAPEPVVETAGPAVEVEKPVMPAEASVEPTMHEGGTVDQAEMRRRIEETRARLKAKAFDAMMSGEAALLRHDGSARPVPMSDEAARLEPDIDLTIDESLSQEDL